MLVSKNNEFNTSSFIDSRNCNERKSSESMELLAYSIINLICKKAASGMYRGALETLQKMMSECIYHEGNAFVIMGVGEQLKRIKYEVGENNLKVFNVHFNNNHELVSSGEPDVICLSKQVWENLLIKLKLENNENVFSETKKLSNKNNDDQFFECAKRNEQNLFDNIRKSDFHVGLLKPSSTRSVILETPPNVCMESRNSYEKKIDEMSSLSESKEHPIDIQEKKDAFVNEFKGILFDKNGRSSEFLLNFYECCYKFLPRAQPQDKIESYNSALQAFSIFCSSTLTHNDVGFNFKLFPEVKLSGGNLETVFKYKNGDDIREMARINIALPKGEGDLYNLGGLDFKGCFFSGQNFSNYDIKYVNWRTSLFDVDAPCIFNVPDDNKSYEKLLKSVSENGLNGVLTDRINKIKLITGVAPFDGISSMDDDFDDSSSEENSPVDSPIENRPLV